MPLFQRTQQTITVTVLAGTFLYAAIRYNIIKGVAWEHFPLFISNKAIALASVAFIALSYMLGPLARFWPQTMVPLLPARKFFGLLGFGLGAVHGLMSLLLFTPANYPKFFLADGTLNVTGELSMVFGIFSLLIFTAVALTSLPSIAASLKVDQWQFVQRLGYAGLTLVLLHVITMGLEGWLKPATWPGRLLPISLVAAIIIAAALLLRIIVLISPGTYGSQKNK